MCAAIAHAMLRAHARPRPTASDIHQLPCPVPPPAQPFAYGEHSLTLSTYRSTPTPSPAPQPVPVRTTTVLASVGARTPVWRVVTSLGSAVSQWRRSPVTVRSPERVQEMARLTAVDGDEVRRTVSAPGLGSPLATSAPGLGSPLPHLHRDRAHRCHISTGTGLAPPPARVFRCVCGCDRRRRLGGRVPGGMLYVARCTSVYGVGACML